MVRGHFNGNLLSPLLPPINYSVSKTGLASGCNSFYSFKSKYYFKQRSNIAGFNSGSVKANNFEGLNIFRKSQAGYAE